MFASLIGSMPFLPAVDLPIASEVSIPQEFSEETSDSILPEDDLEELLLKDSIYEPKPVELEGSVENFDPVARAQALAENLSRKWCGSYKSFGNTSDDLEVTINFLKINPVGQMVNLEGNMSIENILIPIQGNLNAKSDQLDLILLSDQFIEGIEPGDYFMGLQGINLLGLESTSFIKPGGRLELKQICQSKISKTPAIRSIW